MSLLQIHKTILHYSIWFNQADFLFSFDHSELDQIQFVLIDQFGEGLI